MPIAFHKMIVNAFIKKWKLGVTPRSWKTSHIALIVVLVTPQAERPRGLGWCLQCWLETSEARGLLD
eukprot:7622936-Pyramimonas_sp.AAC.2